MITILDYGLGNLRSVEKALTAVGGQCQISAEFEHSEKLVIPGVGAFGAAMEKIASMSQDIHRFAASGRPILGICLGQQLLFDESEELGRHLGLGLIPGKVTYLPRVDNLKIPHFGWSALSYQYHEGMTKEGVEGEQVYFVHSLHTVCDDPDDVAATAEYGITFAAMVKRKNIWGAQFHPEKSGDVGLRMLRSFVQC